MTPSNETPHPGTAVQAGNGEYLTAKGEWKPCRILGPDKYGNIFIDINGVMHRVPSDGVRTPPVPEGNQASTASSEQGKDEFQCENCGAPATTFDPEGVPLCEPCSELP